MFLVSVFVLEVALSPGNDACTSMVVPLSATKTAMLRMQRPPIAAKARGYMLGPRVIARSTIRPVPDSSSPFSRHANIARTALGQRWCGKLYR